MAWLAAATGAERAAFVKTVLDTIAAIDPGCTQALGIWRAGKTIKVRASIFTADGTPVEIGIHVGIDRDGAEAAFFDRVRRHLEKGGLSLDPGQIQIGTGEDPSASMASAFMTQIDEGTISLTVRHGEIAILLSHRSAVPVPIRAPASVGGVAAGFMVDLPRLPHEGFILFLFEGQLFLVAQFDGLTPAEVEAARTASPSLGLVPATDDLMILAAALPGLANGWCDMPFAAGIEAPQSRRLNPPEADGTSVILLALTEGMTGEVAVLRPLRMSARWTEKLHDIIRRQLEGATGYDRHAYERDVRESRRRWPSPNDLVSSLAVIETVA
jgi:hypothetical protein